MVRTAATNVMLPLPGMVVLLINSGKASYVEHRVRDARDLHRAREVLGATWCCRGHRLCEADESRAPRSPVTACLRGREEWRSVAAVFMNMSTWRVAGTTNADTFSAVNGLENRSL